MIARAAGAAVLAAAGYVGLTWYRYGRTGHAAGEPDQLLDRFMPDFEVREQHRAEIAAPAATTFAAARTLDLRRAPVARGIFRARQLFMGGHAGEDPAGHASFIDEVLGLGWRMLAEEPGRRIIFGAVTQPWRADVVFRGIPPEEFAAFAEPGYVKIVWTIAVVPMGSRSSQFRTETRAIATDPGSRARFRRYWSVVSPGIVMIRRAMLRQVRRDAEARARSQAVGDPAATARLNTESSSRPQARS